MFFLFFPISGRRPEIPVLAGGQGPNIRKIVLELFLGAVSLIGDLSDFRAVIAGKLGLCES